MSNLESLKLEDNSRITGKGIRQLKSLRNLHKLSLRKGDIKVDDLLALKGLKLRFLSFEESRFTRPERDKLAQAFPGAQLLTNARADQGRRREFAPLH